MRIETILTELFSISLFFSCFCRAVKTGPDTRLDVLLAFHVLTLASLLSITAPMFSNWKPDLMHALILGAIAAVQVVTSLHWRQGVPQTMQKHETLPQSFTEKVADSSTNKD